jgi:hypothetical protein
VNELPSDGNFTRKMERGNLSVRAALKSSWPYTDLVMWMGEEKYAIRRDSVASGPSASHHWYKCQSTCPSLLAAIEGYGGLAIRHGPENATSWLLGVEEVLPTCWFSMGEMPLQQCNRFPGAR